MPPTANPTTVKRRLLKTIRTETATAERQASELRADPDKWIYAPLFENAARFWRDLAYYVDQGIAPSSREQAAVLSILRKNAEK